MRKILKDKNGEARCKKDNRIMILQSRRKYKYLKSNKEDEFKNMAFLAPRAQRSKGTKKIEGKNAEKRETMVWKTSGGEKNGRLKPLCNGSPKVKKGEQAVLKIQSRV